MRNQKLIDYLIDLVSFVRNENADRAIGKNILKKVSNYIINQELTLI